MAKNLLIVESPAKARTINKYLGKDFQVLASYGHVRDLKPKEGAVDPAQGFAMHYEPIERNKKHVDAIARAAKSTDAIYLATDRDREGEAISWHMYEILKARGLTDNRVIHRVVFSEITPRAIRAAIADPHRLSQDLVDAQQARRALDYLVGFNLSPVLWRKVQRGLSAGRVQSPALRMIVEREEEIEAFEPREYWTIEAELAHAEGAFRARLSRLDGKKFEQFDLGDEARATAVRERLLEAAAGHLQVGKITRRERKRRPAPPFITSTLQQEAARKLGFTTRRTMRVAQSLYEGIALGNDGNVGLITYMRTDSTALAEEALGELRQLIEEDYGAEALPKAAQHYRTNSRNAQEAHEAIRPTSAMRRPTEVARWLTDDQRRLYELVWKRTVASQMIHATLNTVAVDFPLADANFRATGTTVVTLGFLAVYEEGRDTRAKEDEDAKRRLPKLAEGEEVPLADILADQHFTEPPPRFSEASLVKALEEYGIGRPSTYASIIGVLLDRDYVILDSRRFKPTDVGRTVGKFLAEHFKRYVDYEFTARLEEELDAVSNGKEAWVPLLERFWQPFKERVEEKIETVDRSDASAARELGTDPKSGKPVSVKLGRYGPYAQIGTREDAEKPRFASIPAGYSLHTITFEEALELFKLPRELGQAEDGETISAGIGRFGPFVRKGKVYVSLKKEDSPYTVELPRAKELIEAKLEYLANRIIRDFGNGVQVLNGRYGPYITNGEKNARIPKDRDPKSLGLEECEELLAKAPSRKHRGKKKAAAKKSTAEKASTKKATRKKKTSGRKKTGSRKKKSRAGKAATKPTADDESSARA